MKAAKLRLLKFAPKPPVDALAYVADKYGISATLLMNLVRLAEYGGPDYLLAVDMLMQAFLARLKREGAR